MSAYKPRSGTFRKVKYPLKIYKTAEIPVKDVKNVLEMVAKIKAEETLDCPQYQFDEEEECKGNLLDLSKKRCAKLEGLKLSSEIPESGAAQPKVPKSLPEAQFSLVPDEDDLYQQCYDDDDSLPRYPVASSSGINLSSDSEESARESEYDMDTEDEEWLEANKKSNITPNRLEYVFTKLNKRNTHVPKNAIGALPEAFHDDFHHLFPYWKEKRLQNKNVSTFKPQCPQTAGAMKKDTRLSSGYITSDPYVIFACNPRKSLPHQHPPSLLKVSQKFNKQDVKMYFKRMLEMREKLTNVSSWALETIQSSINARNEIVKNFASFIQNQGTARSGKENPEIQLKAGCNNQIAKRVKLASIPLRVSGRLTNQRKKIALKENSVNKIGMKGNIARQSKKTVLVKLKQKKEEIKLAQGKKPRKLPTFERVFNGKQKNKRIRKAGRFVKVQAAMP